MYDAETRISEFSDLSGGKNLCKKGFHGFLRIKDEKSLIDLACASIKAF